LTNLENPRFIVRKLNISFVSGHDILTPGGATNPADKKQLENSEKHKNSKKILTYNY
jgi:hypothetical protein